MSDPLTPSVSLLANLASIVVHVSEYDSDDGREIDLKAATTLAGDGEVLAWVSLMVEAALAPQKRKRRK